MCPDETPGRPDNVEGSPAAGEGQPNVTDDQAAAGVRPDAPATGPGKTGLDAGAAPTEADPTAPPPDEGEEHPRPTEPELAPAERTTVDPGQAPVDPAPSHPDAQAFREAHDLDGSEVADVDDLDSAPPIVLGETFQLVFKEDYLMDVFPDSTGRSDYAYRILVPSSTQHVGEGVLPIRILELLAQRAVAQKVAGEVVWGDVSAEPARTPIADEFAEAGMPSEPKKGQGEQPTSTEVSAPPVETSDKPAPVGAPAR